MGTVPVPYTPIAGDDATQARVLTWADTDNYLLGNATSGGSKRPLCVLQQTVAQSIGTSSLAAITFDSELVDYDNGHSTVTNTDRYTAATAGWHLISGIAGFAANAAGERLVEIHVNSAVVPGTQARLMTDTVVGVPTGLPAPATLVFLNVGDFVQLVALQSSGGALNTSVAGDCRSKLSVEWRSN